MSTKSTNLPTTTFVFVVTSLVIVGIGLLLYKNSQVNSPTADHKIQVVAAENFWGSLVSQIGGSHVQVDSIVSDPNADPHEYESNNNDARAFANANYVILNGAGYDSWGNKLLAASPKTGRLVLTVADLVGVKNGGNPHLWYNPAFVNTTINQMEANLASLDPTYKNYFQQQLTMLKTKLLPYQTAIANIKKNFSGVQVAATEDIFAYLASAAGLDLVSPPAFIQAVAEGNDPPASSVVLFQQQLEDDHIKVLVYNEQTVTPLTQSMKQLAADKNIPVVGVTETVQPPGTLFQDWMYSEIINLENALNAQALGQ